MRLLSSVSALVLCISCMFATRSDAFILVGRNGVGRGESLRGAQAVEGGNDVVDSVSRYFGSSSSSSSGREASNSNSSGAGDRIAKCRFTAGANDLSKDEQLPSFYIPSKDKELYESGVRELLSQVTDDKADTKSNKPVGTNTPNIALQCEDVSQGISSINCRLCMYNEISKDKKHLRQGQVLDVPLDTCIFGTFNNNMNVFKDANNSFANDYHPICYPPSSSTSSNNSDGATRNRFRKPVESVSKYETPEEMQEIFYLIGEALLGGAESSEIVRDMENGEVMPSTVINGDSVDNIVAPGEVVVVEAKIGDPEADQPEVDNQSYIVEKWDPNAEDNWIYGGEKGVLYDGSYDNENSSQYLGSYGELDTQNYGYGANNYGNEGVYIPNTVSEQNNRDADVYNYDVADLDSGDVPPMENRDMHLLDNSQVLSGRELLALADSNAVYHMGEY